MFIKKINPYCNDNFDSIRKNLNERGQERYHQKWMQSYSKLFKRNDQFEIIDLRVREWKAIKEMYAASILLSEAKRNYKYKCESSFFFALYYSLFHAQLACMCYNTNISLERLTNIGHKSLGNQFKATFCEGRNLISNTNIPENFEKLRNLREYYSYALPINALEFEKETIEITQNQIKECFQITSLHSLFLELSSDKNLNLLEFNNPEKDTYLINTFIDTMTRPLDQRSIDPADEDMLSRIQRDGIDFNSIFLLIEHTFDEFRTYSEFNDTEEDDDMHHEIYAFIYNSIT